MRSLLLAVVLAWMASSTCLAQPAPRDWLKPPALKRGDLVAIVAPAGPFESSALTPFVESLTKAGYRVRVPAGMEGRKLPYLAGTDDQRVDELNAAIRDREVRAIVAARGGYGLTRILDRVDYRALRADPKIVAGYSDLTALHLAIGRHARVVSFHSPMPLSSLGREDRPDYVFAARSFRRAIFADQYTAGGVGYPIALPESDRPAPLVSGRATGRLTGGNLSLVAATLGTPYAVEPDGAILFLEDVHEAPYRVDRMLSQLRLAGVLDRVAGVVLGRFTTDDPNEAAEVDRVLRDAFGRLKVPVAWRFPVGHVPLNATIPEGATAVLDADAGTVTLTENPVRID